MNNLALTGKPNNGRIHIRVSGNHMDGQRLTLSASAVVAQLLAAIETH